MAEWQRTHTCDQLREEHVGSTATLNGWVLTARDNGHQVFIDLRDRYGLTQVVFRKADDAELFACAQRLKAEWVLSVTGTVQKRLEGAARADIATGAIELEAKTLRVLNECPPLPFQVDEFGTELANEDLRLQYRYLDLRRRTLQKTLVLRHRLCKVIRDYMDANHFLEVETPLLGKSTPEGARDYLVPSRVFNGEFFALPQSPQLYKQLLMISGYDRYFQIARCLRDEDLRADRQPEFTQLDVEMSFVEREDVLSVMEKLAADIFDKCLGVKLPLPFPRLGYAEAMAKYGSDKPDLRFGLEIVDITDIAGASEAQFLKDAVAGGGVVRAINAKGGAAAFSNTALKPGGELPKVAETYKAKGLAWMKVEGGKFTGSTEKFFSDELKAKLKERLSAADGDLLLFVADKEAVVCDALGALRIHLATKLKLYKNWWDEKAEHEKAEKDKADAAKKKKEVYVPVPFQPRAEHFNFAWVLDFPMFTWNEEENRWDAMHHPFTAPMDEDLPNFWQNESLGKVRAKAYDMVLNGYEVGGGSIRIHRQDVQSRVFEIFGMTPEDAQGRFGFLLDALKSGAPPHGGIALGLDRWAMVIAGTTNIRDVIAFPKNQKARDLMTGAPAAVDARQLKELGVKLS
ncbi:Aspartate--tRNA ligase [Gemmata obscuriglobus]|uniref:Aspartate--tRNA(Asp/Asn) ligase n=1 Tax=Gemmata obscuriglobus TaxID=114 RepID=A0A2Z3GUL4_9BACT|nr:aspartate--tRNA ligase [Gemmata obscuriglobus]AWM38109.1 aspartate--tRNA ligase [Gemmata obscuriglobus]QEG29010.1 Aspartate--tRNA ligase [Gemmata obscuriglobus]VTS07595.1 aspartyl-trna synthetase : Aspartate--tRNA(Asp/Asn) ligase OS=Bacillus thuringiensis serovar pakistani str. T13001 GN=aspS PE=3 SV=1: tRNA_anti-codon: tRNA-synt_2: GAD [Gemmata obscuriglobus UQM 2246]